jgi:hypothetical protein
MATPAGPSFESVLEFTHRFREQYTALLDSLRFEPVPVLIKENWKVKDDKTVADFADYVAHRIRAEAGMSEQLKNALAGAINLQLIQPIFDELKPKKGHQKKRVRQVRVNRTTFETFVINHPDDTGSDGEDDDDDNAVQEADAAQEFYLFKLVFSEKRENDGDSIYKFRLRGTLYRHVCDQGLCDTLAAVYNSLPRA